MSSTDDCKEPFHGPYPLKIRLDELGYIGYDLRIDESGQIQCWSMSKTGGAADGRMLKSHNGRVQLYGNGEKSTVRLHKIWCLVVHGPPPSDGQKWSVDHIDRNHKNNSPFNLRWATASQQSVNRDTWRHKMVWVPLTDDDEILERRQFLHRWFIETGYEVKLRKKDCVWRKAVSRTLTHDGYVHCDINKCSYGMNRIITHIFGGRDDIKLVDIYDDSIIIEHLDHDKTNNHKNNLLVSNQSNNMKTWHASGKSNKRAVYAMSKEDETDVREFDSAADASRKIQRGGGTNITRVCRGQTASAYGFYWSYEPFN